MVSVTSWLGRRHDVVTLNKANAHNKSYELRSDQKVGYMINRRDSTRGPVGFRLCWHATSLVY